MTSNFLQRFKGKTTTLTKNQVNDILGSKNITPSQTNKPISSDPNHPPKKTKSCIGQNTNNNFNQDIKNKTNKQPIEYHPMKTNKTQNPFLVANPFYLDQQEKEKQQLKRQEKLKLEFSIRKMQQNQNNTNETKNQKQTGKSFGYSRSLEKKNSGSKQWVRFGGLGANIGGDQWLQKKKKQQKMQQFAGQVKSINAQKIIKPPKPQLPKYKSQKQSNARQKALQYSKNIPKPIIRKLQQLDDEEQLNTYQEKPMTEEQPLTELQIYEMKHQQLKKIINHHY